MNNEEAKLILQAYRADGQDASDPRFREALEQAQRDPDLARWFANEQTLDARIGAKLRKSTPVPADLKAQLLAQRKIVRPAIWWQRPSARYAMAAGFALFATIAGWFGFVHEGAIEARGNTFADYRDAMADFTGNKLKRLEFRTRDVAEAKRWLAEKGSIAELTLPKGLEGKPSFGCRVLEWQGKKVSLVCFELANRKVVHLLTVDSSIFEHAPGESPEFKQAVDVAMASWSRSGKTYVLTSKRADESELKNLF
ncbi:MAG: hypothetical protein AAB370_03195 [Verrucomicrobiota bacterium]